MHVQRLLTLGVLGLVLAGYARGQDAPVPSGNVVTVKVDGEGISKEAAVQAAMRRAVEQGGQVELSSHSHVENFELLRDAIYSRADGFIQSFDVLEERPSANGYWVRIRARVNQDVIASTWGEVQNLLDQIGRPRIVVLIDEEIDGVPQKSSILESTLENRLLKVGFDVYNGPQIDEIRRRESDDASIESNQAKVQAIAKDFGAQIFITGTSQANAAGVREVAGTQLAMYNCDALIKVFYTDTGKLVASEALSNVRGGARGHFTISPQAGKEGLKSAGETLVDWMYFSAMKYWTTMITAGGELVLEVENLRSIVDAVRIKKMLEEIEGVQSVNQSFTKGIGTFRIQAKMTGQTLLEHLIEPPFDQSFEVVDMKLNRIQAKGM